jgi:NADH:ubiquinone oxidoreductase subunit E
MQNKTDITICLGSSCFSRGNDLVLEVIKEYLKDNDLKEMVNFKGHLCVEQCNRGPMVRINGRDFEGVNTENILEILDHHFEKVLATRFADKQL